jgi:hypothetical protein
MFSCFLFFQLHHQMSPAQLRQIFHVDLPDLVPHYEIIALNHHTTLHSVKRRSIGDSANSDSLLKNRNSLVNSNSLSATISKNYNHHVKKDLSKTPFDEKVPLKQLVINSVNQKIATAAKSTNRSDADVNGSDDGGGTTMTKVSKNQIDFSDISLSDIKEHNVSFEAFGEKLHLNLRPTEGLFKDGPQNLRMWNVRSDPNATQGLIYEEIEEVSQ